MQFREAAAADREAILALRARCFPGDDPEKRDPRFWDWEFRGGRMFVADADGRIAAHLGFLPQEHVVRGERARSLLAVDAMTDPDFRRQGLFARLAQHARDAIRGVAFSSAWQIRSAVRGGMAAGGWQEVGGARVLLRPLLRTPVGREGEPEAMAEIARAFFAKSEAYLHRTPQWLRWRYFENPLWRYDIAMNDDAWIVTRRTRLKGVDTLAIVDLAWRSEKAAKALLTGPRVRLAAALFTRDHPAHGWGIPGPHRFKLLVNDFALHAAPRWALAWGDTDHL